MLRHQIFLTALALLAITTAAVPLKNEVQVSDLGDRFPDINFGPDGAIMPDKAPSNFVTLPPGP